jgi:serine/threonine protein phosphatase PrpC
MTYSLDLHTAGYNISLADLRRSFDTRFSGEPFAKRHRELARHHPHHAMIANLQEIPYLGGLLALFERVAMVELNTIFHKLEIVPSLRERVEIQKLHWKPRQLSVDLSMKKMWKNMCKATNEHNKKENVYIQGEASLERVLSASAEPLSFKADIAIAQGVRPSMEDDHFVFETADEVLTAVFDGHGGDQVAKYASSQFQEIFFDVLDAKEGCVHQTFEAVLHEIQDAIAKQSEWNKIGSTVVVCYIDKKTGLIYTATVGDSEANLYRKGESDTLQSIPLSCIRDWSSQKDAHRVCLAKKDIWIDRDWIGHPQPKHLRYPHGDSGLNVSRSLGDMQYHPVVIHKPKITVNRVRSGDLLVLACDGLKDYVSEKEIIEQLMQKNTTSTLSEQLVLYALTNKKSKDNITVIVFQF